VFPENVISARVDPCDPTEIGAPPLTSAKWVPLTSRENEDLLDRRTAQQCHRIGVDCQLSVHDVSCDLDDGRPPLA
jgi:hypothetical protein